MNIRCCWGWRSAVAGVMAAVPAPLFGAGPVTLDSLLKEMVDRAALSQFPDPPYTCKQFSSYDRASTTPDDPKTWFANGDANQYLRVEEVAGADGKTRKEWVMADMDGPGAIVRLWSANPKGTLRVYLDGEKTPAIEAPMADVLGGKWKVHPPIAMELSRGWNLYAPIPYAKHCKVTSDQDGFYYQVNYRTYAAGTAVTSYTDAEMDKAFAPGGPGAEASNALLKIPKPVHAMNFGVFKVGPGPIEAGKTGEVKLEDGPRRVVSLAIRFQAHDLEQALRSTVIVGDFDGEQTIWCPLSDFFGSGVGANQVLTFEQRCSKARPVKGEMACELACGWVMPYEHEGKLTLVNLGQQPVAAMVTYTTEAAPWTERSMHFHSAWHYQYPIHAYGGRGTMDWNYVEVKGKGVYVGDALAVMNPVPEWWGEGDEKIYVDGERFPSHFGTGTEDYYGYAWCCPIPFQNPFHAEPRADGHAHHDNNWGHTTVTRVRALDAIPFASSLKFDMEVWHWKECDEAYAATTYFYARPGATTNRPPQPGDAAKAVPQPPPLPPVFKVAGAIECEEMKVLGKSEGLTVIEQDMASFARNTWSNDSQLWVQGRKPGDFVELEVPAGEGPEAQRPMRFDVYATRSWDYGKVRFTVNGHPTDEAEDLYSGEHGKVLSTGPIDLGVFKPEHGKFVLRAEVVGGNEKSEGSRSFFGLDCVVLKPAGPEDMKNEGVMDDDDHAPAVKH